MPKEIRATALWAWLRIIMPNTIGATVLWAWPLKSNRSANSKSAVPEAYRSAAFDAFDAGMK